MSNIANLFPKLNQKATKFDPSLTHNLTQEKSKNPKPDQSIPSCTQQHHSESFLLEIFSSRIVGQASHKLKKKSYEKYVE